LESSLLFSLFDDRKIAADVAAASHVCPPRLVACRNRAYLIASAAATSRATMAQ
jgi:hypothetical protein